MTTEQRYTAEELLGLVYLHEYVKYVAEELKHPPPLCECPRPVQVGRPNWLDWCRCSVCKKAVAMMEVAEQTAVLVQ